MGMEGKQEECGGTWDEGGVTRSASESVARKRGKGAKGNE